MDSLSTNITDETAGFLTTFDVYCLDVSSSNEFPWDILRERARQAAATAYAPYSNIAVGAAGVTTDGRIVEGANVENASYGLTLCAECSLVSDLIRQGGGHLAAVSIVTRDGSPLAPCGRCRQLLLEHGAESLQVDAGARRAPSTIRELLPEAFGPADLDAGSVS